jgi:hypothetical protein
MAAVTGKREYIYRLLEISFRLGESLFRLVSKSGSRRSKTENNSSKKEKSYRIAKNQGILANEPIRPKEAGPCRGISPPG